MVGMGSEGTVVGSGVADGLLESRSRKSSTGVADDVDKTPGRSITPTFVLRHRRLPPVRLAGIGDGSHRSIVMSNSCTRPLRSIKYIIITGGMKRRICVRTEGGKVRFRSQGRER